MYLARDLAINGGTPVTTQATPPWPYFEDDEIEAVSRVLRSGKVNYWTGNEAVAFEAQFAEYLGAAHAIALANGTVSLELALYALGIGPGDDVIVTPRTFIASASCVVARGARPVLADIDRTSGNLTASSIETALTPATKAVIVVHLGGWPCEMDEIMALAAKHDLVVIEDCAQSLGGTYRGRTLGTIGHAGSFSFCQDKIMTTGGEGGMLALSDEALFETAWSYKDHGKSYRLARGSAPAAGTSFRWLHESFGTNWRMTEMQAAIGRIALAKVPGWVERRRAFARLLDACVSGLPELRLAAPAPHEGHAYYKYYTYVIPEALAPDWDRDRIAQAVQAEGIPCFSGSCPEIYREKAFENAGLAPAERLPVAKELGETSLMLLVHPTLAERDIDMACEALTKVMTVAAAS